MKKKNKFRFWIMLYVIIILLFSGIGIVFAAHLTTKTITIDSSFSDWDVVFANPNNVVYDDLLNYGDPDNETNKPVQTSRDAVKFAYTEDNNYMYFYFKRAISDNSQFNWLIYTDLNNDKKMTYGIDKVILFSLNVPQNKWSSVIYDYNNVNSGGDSLTGDGVNMPGSISNPITIETLNSGIGADKLQFETRLSYSVFGIGPNYPLNIHIALTKGSGTNVPSQLNDNMDIFSAALPDVHIFPNYVKSAGKGTIVTFNHTILNNGRVNDTFEINITNSELNITVYGSDGVTKLVDTDGDGIIDIGMLPRNMSTNIIVSIYIPDNCTCNLVQIIKVTAISSLDPNIFDTAIDQLGIGAISIVPTLNQKVVAGYYVDFDHTIYNNQNFEDRINLNLSSTQGYNFTFKDAFGVDLSDTDSNGLQDINISANSYVNITLRVFVPFGKAIGTVDNATVYAISGKNPSIYATAIDKSTVAPWIEIIPNYSIDVGVGTSYFMKHTVYNNYISNDTVDIKIINGIFNYTLFKEDKISSLVDTDGDGIKDVGPIEPFGGYKEFYVKVFIPPSVPVNTTENVTVRANSSIDTSVISKAYDVIRAKILVVFNDSSYTKIDKYFFRNETAYIGAFGTGLSTKNVLIQYNYPNGSVAYLDYTSTNADQSAFGSFYIKPSMPTGIYTVSLLYRPQQNKPYQQIDVNTFEVILRPPKITNLQERPLDPATYNPTGAGTYKFNATITGESLNSVSFYWQNVKYTPTNNSNVFSYTFLNNLAAGTYNYYWWVNNSAGTVVNATGTYTVNKALPIITLKILPSENVQQGTQTNVSCTKNTDQVKITLYRNGINVSNPDIQTLAAGSYNYVCNTSGNQNYSARSVSQTLDVYPFMPNVAFTLTLPGQPPVNGTNLGNWTASMIFNSTLNSVNGTEPCVYGSNYCQNKTTPFFVYTNTGDVNLTFAIYLDYDFPSVFRLKTNNISNYTSSVEVTTSSLIIATNIMPGNTHSQYFYGDFINAYPTDSTSRSLTSSGT